MKLIIRGILNGDTSKDTWGFCGLMYYFECSGPVVVWDEESFGSKLVTFDNNEYYVDPVSVSVPYYSTSDNSEHPNDFISQNPEIMYREYNHECYREIFIGGGRDGGIVVVSMPGATPPAVFPFKKTYKPWVSKRKNLEKVKRYV